MSLLDQARADIQKITSNSNEFAQAITFTSKKYGTIRTVYGLANKINISVDTQGNPIHSKNATIAISEAVLTEYGYPVRNGDGEVDMLGDLIDVADNTGVTKSYQVNSKIPDETLGIIVLILEDFERYVAN